MNSRLYCALWVPSSTSLATVLALVLLGFGEPFGASSAGQSATVECRQSTLKLVLSPQEGTYKPGEPITLVYRIENVGADPLYIDPDLPDSGAGSSLNGLEVELFDGEGKKLPHKMLEGLFRGFHPATDVVGWITGDWVKLSPRHFYGMEEELPLSFYEPLSKPGRYKLVATYYNYTDHWLTEEQRLALKRLNISIWCGRVSSEPIWIEVRK